MWIIFKLLISLGALYYQFLSKYVSPSGLRKSKLNELIYFFKKDNFNEFNTSSTLGLELKNKITFKITKESYWDKFFKQVGFSHEFQTGNQNFDEKYYIASDDSSFCQKIATDSKISELIDELFKSNCSYIFSNGLMIWAKFLDDRSKDERIINCLNELKEKLLNLESKKKYDALFFQIIFIESIICLVSIYTWLGILEWYAFEEDVNLNIYSIYAFGFFCGLLLSIIVIGIIYIFLKGSSRGHRIIVECTLYLVLSFPLGGCFVISDINKGLDQSPPLIVRAKILSAYRKPSNKFRRRGTYTYHLKVSSIENPSRLILPKHMTISYSNFLKLKNSSSVDIVIGRGYLNFPWYKSFNPASDS
jgi:hypothetical protein